MQVRRSRLAAAARNQAVGGVCAREARADEARTKRGRQGEEGGGGWRTSEEGGVANNKRFS